MAKERTVEQVRDWLFEGKYLWMDEIPEVDITVEFLLDRLERLTTAAEAVVVIWQEEEPNPSLTLNRCMRELQAALKEKK